MAVQLITNQQYASPSAASNVAVTATGVAWTNSAWTQIAATTDTVWILVSLICSTTDSNVTSSDMEVDIGTGGAGSEVVLTTIRRRCQQDSSLIPDTIRFLIPIDNLNGRHAVRVRCSHARAAAYFFAITYLKNPISGTLQVTTKPTKCYPAAANSPTVVSSGTPWVNSAWVQIVAATATDIVLTHVVAEVIQAGGESDIEIGVGAAGFEVVVTTVRASSFSAHTQSGGLYELPNPLDNIPTGSRIAFRVRCNIASITHACALIYQEKPL